MDKRIPALRTLFELLYHEQRAAWDANYHREDRRAPAEARRVQAELANHYDWLEEEELEHWFPRSAQALDIDFSRHHTVLYLPPLEKKNADFVPMLSLQCQLNDDKEFIRLRIMLFCLAKTHDNAEEHLAGIGFRLESPSSTEYDADSPNEFAGQAEENDERDGRHEFWHAQLMRSVGWGPAYDCPSWLPCDQPSFPLTAKSPAGLILSMLLTLYGKRFCWNFYSRHAYRLRDHIHSHLKQMQPWIGWEELCD